jgi:hypothetical protein
MAPVALRDWATKLRSCRTVPVFVLLTLVGVVLNLLHNLQTCVDVVRPLTHRRKPVRIPLRLCPPHASSAARRLPPAPQLQAMAPSLLQHQLRPPAVRARPPRLLQPLPLPQSQQPWHPASGSSQPLPLPLRRRHPRERLAAGPALLGRLHSSSEPLPSWREGTLCCSSTSEGGAQFWVCTGPVGHGRKPVRTRGTPCSGTNGSMAVLNATAFACWHV